MKRRVRDITAPVHIAVWCVLALAVVIVIDGGIRYASGDLAGWWVLGGVSR